MCIHKPCWGTCKNKTTDTYTMMRNDSGIIPCPTIRFKEGDYVVIYLKIYNLFRKFKNIKCQVKK